jgi:clan AA aspartic protease
MGLVYADIELINSFELIACKKGIIPKSEVKRMKISALVDSGAYMLSINEEIKLQLGLETFDVQEAELADGTICSIEIVGPVEVHFENRKTVVNAAVLPGKVEPLLGAIPMEDMDVLIDLRQQKLIVNPAHPHMAKKSLK